MLRLITLATLAVVGWACSDNNEDKEGDAGHAGDAGPKPPDQGPPVFTDGRVVDFGAPDIGADIGTDAPPPMPRYVGSVFTDFAGDATLRFALLENVGLFTPSVLSVHSDSYLRWTEGGFRVIQRFGSDSFRGVDPEVGTLSDPISTGANTNPQSIVVTEDGTTFLSLYEASADGHHLVWFDPGSATVSGGLNLETYTDDDGNRMPRAAALALCGPLYLALQDLDGFTVTTSGKLLAIDPSTKTVTDSIGLLGDNPATTMACNLAGDRLFIPHQGDYGAEGAGGGVEVVDTGVPETLGLELNAVDLNGGVSAIALGESWGYALSSTSFPSDIYHFDPLFPSDNFGLFVSANGYAGEIHFAPGLGLLVPDGDRVRVFDELGEQIGETEAGPEGAVSVAAN